MATLTLLVFLLLIARQAASAEPAPSPGPVAPPPAPLPPFPSPSAPTVTPAAYHPPAWPQVVPAGLPAFPGPGWTADEPPGPGVVARAWALLSQLWASGAGTFKIEQTQGRWIAYRATAMGTKKGVVAYKLREPSGGEGLTQA